MSATAVRRGGDPAALAPLSCSAACEAAGAIPAAALAEPGLLGAVLRRHHGTLGGEWRPACSYWHQCYVAALVVPAVAQVLEAAAPVPLGLGDLGVVLCPRRGVPLGFFRPAGAVAPDPVAALLSLVDGHLGPLTHACACAARLSERLLRENAVWPLVFALGGALREVPGARASVEAFLDRLADARAPLPIPRDAVLEGAPFRRRLCCLRERVPGLARCPGLCPRDALPPGASRPSTGSEDEPRA